MKNAEKFLRALSSRVFVGRIPFFPDFHFCAASVEPACGGRIDVAGVGREKEQAIMSAYGEAVETLSQDVRENDPVLSSTRGAQEFLGWLADTPKELWQKQIMAQSHCGSFSFKAPAACVLRMNNGDDGLPPISEGAAAGPTLDAAKLASMLELIERDSVAKWWRGGQPARRIGRGTMERIGEDPREVLILDLSHGALAPVVAMISRCTRRSEFAFSAACRPTFSEANMAALRELVQFEVSQVSRRHRYGEAATNKDKKEYQARKEILDLAGPFNDTLKTVDDLRAGNTQCVLEELLLRAEKQSVRFGIVNLTRQEFNLPVVKTISPDLQPTKMQTITPSVRSLQKLWAPPDPKRRLIELYL